MKHARSDYDPIQDPRGLIPEDEPVFLIRAKDLVGWRAVRSWADLAEAAGAGEGIVHRARTHALAMREWQRKHGCQIPDMPKETE